MKKRILIAVTVLFAGLIVFRILFSLITAEQGKAMSNQYLAEWSKMSEDEMLSDMDQRINAINPKPFGFNSDGLFNESFDDMFAVDDKGPTYVDAHDAIEAVTQAFMVNRIGLIRGRLALQQLQQFGEATLRGLGVDTSQIPQEADLDETKSRIFNLAMELVSLRFKAFVAQWLGFIDILIGLNAICLLFIVASWFLRRQRSKMPAQLMKVTPGIPEKVVKGLKQVESQEGEPEPIVKAAIQKETPKIKQAVNPAPEIICSKCGNVGFPKDKFCRKCGNPLR